MALFPAYAFADVADYVTAYAAAIAECFASIEPSQIRQAALAVERVVVGGGTLFACGNGGSAAIANHLVCDCVKGMRANSGLAPKVHSLSANVEILTAIANDMAYDEVFRYQLECLSAPGDLLIAISSSGNSPNILQALRWARNNGRTTIAMTGFDGGDAARLAEISLHVMAENYGVVEDVHQSLMHLLAQYLRQRHIADPKLVGTVKF